METTRAGIAIYKINYQSDFILTVVCDVEWGTPFCIKFWTGEPAQAYYVGWDGKEYKNCKVVESDPSKLLVLFDDHHLPVGELKMQIAYHTTIEDFPNAIVDEVTNSMKIMAYIDGKNQKIALDFEGEEAAELQFELPAYANEAQRIANEEQRIANEQARIEAEQQRIDKEQTRQNNEAQRIAQETARVNEYAELKADAVAATDAANNAATLANQKAQLAADKAALADAAATLANQKAQLAADKAALADAAATLANQKAEYADAQGDYAKEQGDYAKEQGDTALADHRRAESDHETAASDHTIAANDHTQAGNDHTRAESDHSTATDDHTLAASDHSTAAADHTLAASDHSTAADDHTLAASDHSTAANDHTQAGNDHTRAESDHTRAESDHAAVEVYVDSLGAFDISSYHATGGVLAKYADLTAALGTGGANIPEAIRKGGMSVKYVQSSDNNYIQARLMANAFTTDITKWQGVDNKLIPQSINLIDSASVAELGVKVGEKYEMKDDFPLKTGYVNNQSKLAVSVDYYFGVLLVKKGWYIEVTRDTNMPSYNPTLSIAASANVTYGDSVTKLKGNTFFATQDTCLVISVGTSLTSLLVSKVETTTSKENCTLYGEIRPFESGSCADGTESDYRAGDIIINSNRICSRFNIVKHGSVIKYSIAEGYRAAFKSWDGENVITDKISWLTGSGEWTPQNDIVFIIGAKNVEGAIDVSDSVNFHILSLEDYIDGVKEKVEEINEIINDKTIILNTFEQGGVQDGDVPTYPAGSLFPVDNRISTRHNLVTPNKAIDYSITDGYRAAFKSWDGESSLITDKTGWLTGTGQFTPVNEYLYIIVAKVDNTNLLPSVGTSAISVMYKSVIGEMQDEIDKNSAYVDEQLSNNVIDCWGDSLTQSSGGIYPDELARLTGRTVNNFGDGGEATLHIAGRHGGCPACLKEDLCIPASGGVVVSLKSTYKDWDYSNGSYFLRSRNSGINPCCIGGIVGELSYSANGTVFTRSEAGSAKTIKAGELVYPRWGVNTTNHIQIIWIGQNVDGSFSTNDELVEIVKDMIQYYNNDKFIAVCFIQRNTGGVEAVQAAEKVFKSAFGFKSFCPREYLNHFGIEKAIENGYIQSATAQDELDIAAGLIPSSLRSDAVHLNTYGYKLVAQRIYELMVQNKYI